MITATLTRWCYSPHETFGSLLLPFNGTGYRAYTIERPWFENAPFVSCIPEGSYLCRRGHFPKHGETFEVTGVSNRSAILFHVANVAKDVQGCIGLGARLGVLDGYWAVHGSAEAFQKFLETLDKVKSFTLVITHHGGTT